MPCDEISRVPCKTQRAMRSAARHSANDIMTTQLNHAFLNKLTATVAKQEAWAYNKG